MRAALSAALLCSCAESAQLHARSAEAAGSMRSMVYRAAVARSGQTSDCGAFSALFSVDGVYEAPVGSPPAVGPAAIAAACEGWNAQLGPQGNGWYPGELYSSPNRTSFPLHVRAVGAGGCSTSVQGIVHMSYDGAADAILRWEHFYDADYVTPMLAGKCALASG
jgi:hypothetical protein